MLKFVEGKMNAKINYPFMIRPLDVKEGSGFLIEFPDFPGCIADGATIEEVIHAGKDALKSWIITAKEFGDEGLKIPNKI
jgi:antitoxin HicB